MKDGLKTAILTLLLVGVGGHWAQVQVQVQAQDQPVTVQEIRVLGNEQVSTALILEQITFQEGETVGQEAIRQSAQNIMDMGFFQEVRPELEEVEGGFRITFRLVENPVIEKIEVTGNTHVTEWNILGLKIPWYWFIVKTERIKEILEEHEVKTGQILNINRLKEALQAVLQEYQKQGYTLIDIDLARILETLEAEPTLLIPIVERTVEEVVIEGLPPELLDAVRPLIRLPLGEPVKIRNLQISFRNLNNSIYVNPVGTEDLSFAPGEGPVGLKMIFHLRPRILLDRPQAIQAILFTGNTVYPEARLQRSLPPLSGEPLDNVALLHVLQPVYALYHENGYTFMSLVPQGVENGVLTLRIREGVVSEVVVQGNERTKEYVIRRSLQIRPGDVYNENLVRDSYRTLMGLGYFNQVDYNFEGPDETGQVRLIFTVFEKDRLGSFNGSLSYQPEVGLVGKLSVSDKNLFGTGQDISLSYDRGLVGKLQANWSLKYSTHVFFPEYKNFTVKLFQKFKELSAEEEFNSAGGELSVTYPLDSRTDLTLSGRHENTQKCPRDGGQCKPPGVTDSVTLGLTHDDRDSPTFATEGGRRSFRLEQAGGFSVGTTFTKARFSLVQHFPTLERQNVALRLMGGLAWGWWGLDLPQQERFRLGGPTTVRGFPSETTERLLVFNGEYRVQPDPAVSVALFADLGVGDQAALKSSLGVELQVMTPFLGLLRLGLAWRLVEPFSPVPEFSFAFGPMF